MSDRTWLQATVTATLTIMVFGLIRAFGGGRWFPRLPEADPNTPASARDRWSYYGANLVALAIGALGAFGLYVATPPHRAPMRYSPFDEDGRWIGPLLVVMALGALVLPTLLRWFVRPGPLLHLLHKANRRWGGLDMRPACVWTGLIVGSIAVLLHASLREIHTTLNEDGVRWRDVPWQQEEVRPWSELTDLRIVRTFEGKTGQTIERPHLGLTFRDGVQVLAGRDHGRPADFWESPAAFVSRHSGVAVRRVER